MEIKTAYYQERLEEFTTHIQSSKSTRSGDHYTGEVERFLIYLEGRKVRSLKVITEQIMLEYYEYLKSRPKQRGKGTLSQVSINGNLTSLRIFSNRMLDGKQINRSLPIPRNIRIERDKDNYFTTREMLNIEEVDEILKACIDEMEKALIALAYGCGMRRIELVNLMDSHINYVSGVITIVESKGNKTAEVVASKKHLSRIKHFGVERMKRLSVSGKSSPRYFIDMNGKEMSGDQLNTLLKKIIKRTSNESIIEKGITLHCLRHSIATHFVNEEGKSLNEVRSFLRHSKLDTTAIYAKRNKQYFRV